MGLTPKQQRFARELPTAPSKAEAARRAGYTKANARQAAQDVLTSPYIAPAIAKEQAKVEQQVGMTREQWAFRLLREADAGSYDEASQARIAALRTIGEACGWLKHDVEVKIDNPRFITAVGKITAEFLTDPATYAEWAKRVDQACR